MESTAEQEKICDSFIKLTGVAKEQAKFFLESANYNFELAVQQFYENSEDIVEQSFVRTPSETSPGREETESVSYLAEMSDEESSTKNNESKEKSSSRNSNIATLSSIRDDHDPGGQAFYAGGSEHSGQQVLGPQKANSDSDHIVSEMFRQAREHAISEDDLNKAQSKPAFSGFGTTLGSATETSKKVFAGPSNYLPGHSNSEESERETTLKLWRDGFSIDDGPLRSYNDPSNSEFLNAIRTGQIPKELSRGGRSEVHIKMEDHRTEEYQQPPKKPAKPFSGEGQRLGAPSSEIITQASGLQLNDPLSREEALNNANAYLRFDASQPHTRVQIRLADGSRLVPQINIDRNISDLRQYICIARPEYGASQFELMTTFPNKIIEDETLTIKDSGLSNASVVQRIKNE